MSDSQAVVDGTVKWDGIAPGEYVLMAEAPSFEPVSQKVEISGGTAGHAAVELQPLFELTGSVVDAAGHPIRTPPSRIRASRRRSSSA